MLLLTIYFIINIVLCVMLFISFMGKIRANDILGLFLCLFFGVFILIGRWVYLRFKTPDYGV